MPGSKASSSVSVIIPVYGNHNLLLQTIASVKHQAGDYDIKTIIIDDHSPQPIKPIIIKKYPDVKVFRNKKNLIAGLSRNKGLSLAGKSDYVAFLDADDIWEPSFIDQSIKKIENNNLVGSIALSTPLFGNDIGLAFKLKIRTLSIIRDFFQFFFYYFNRQLMPQSSFYLCQLSHLVYKKEDIEGILFDKKYNNGGEDWKFVLETMDRGKVGIVKKRLVHYRYHKKSATQKPEVLKRKWGSYIQLFSELKKRNIKDPMTILFRYYINLLSGRKITTRYE